MALEIIRKPRYLRTEADFKKAYNILYRNDQTITNSLQYEDIIDFNPILDNLQLLSKSRFMKFEWCPFQFKCGYIMKIKDITERRIMIDGKNLHLVNQQFWEKGITLQDLLEVKINDLPKLIYTKYRKLIPEENISTFLTQMISNFVWFETNRINEIFNEKEQTKETIERYVFPVANELAIENSSNNLMGIIDRIDRTTNECYAVIEYKYGKPKSMEKQWQKTKVMDELAFYSLLMQGDQVDVVCEDYHLENIEDFLGFKPLFYYGAMLFFQDIETTSRLYKIGKRKLRGVSKRIDRFWNCLDQGQFKPKPNQSCHQWCSFYWDMCELNTEWLEIDNQVSI
jgi:hypothetical protein